jgi:hypothetical protein
MTSQEPIYPEPPVTQTFVQRLAMLYDDCSYVVSAFGRADGALHI